MQFDCVLTGTYLIVIFTLSPQIHRGSCIMIKFEYRHSVRHEWLLVNASYVTGSRQMLLL